MDGQVLGGGDGAALVDGLANHVDDSAQSFGAHRHLDGAARVTHRLAAHQTFGGVERNGAHVVATQVLGDLEHETVLRALDLQRVEDGRQFAFELHVHDGADHLRNFARRGAEASCTSTRSVENERVFDGEVMAYAGLQVW